MLKLTYTETDVRVERLEIPPETFIADRAILCARAGLAVAVEPGRASFLLDRRTADPSRLAAIADRSTDGIEICLADRDFVEISLSGIWLGSVSGEGVFAAALSPECERAIAALWAKTPARCLPD